jgi:hypothetical protein
MKLQNWYGTSSNPLLYRSGFFLRDGRSIVAPKHAEKAKLRTNGKNYFLAKLMGGEI